MELQELVARARMLFAGAPKRVIVFNLVNGRRSTQEIAIRAGRPLTSVLADLQKMRDMGLITYRKTSARKDLTVDGHAVYEKDVLLKHLSASYFKSPEKIQAHVPKPEKKRKGSGRTTGALVIPKETEIIDICAAGEDQLYEFKQAGIEVGKLAKEICAFANTRAGGFIFYGVADDGTVLGTDKTRQAFDPALQNNIKSTINPSISIQLVEREVLGKKILVIAVPPRSRDDVYTWNHTVYIRKGTVAAPATGSEQKKLYAGKDVI